ncbi:uncharacterized protein IL334_000563 [Kwoniella shivajii]|uniref:Uncharacterized protein n=1 Tax=Kwoniella shivajii TaxID=564305 RepID=A0ABZ1CPG2_9TREE|nr:hypothetical protein IL334_000563 [Kwoniella shivajii]
MAILSNHPMRALSPITELTTPTSLRTLRLPLEEANYLSERRTSYDQDGQREQNHETDDDSVYSQLSAETVKEQHKDANDNQRDADEPGTPIRKRSVSLPVSSPTPPPRSPRRIIPSSKFDTLSSPQIEYTENQLIPFPPQTSTDAPGGLPPPPRSQLPTKPKLLRRITPPVTSSLDHVDRNMTGVGAGKSLSSEISHSLPSSIYSQPLEGTSRNASPFKGSFQGLPAEYSESTFHNVPLFIPPSNTSSAHPLPRSRPNSLKKRPRSSYSSKPSSTQSRPDSIKDDQSFSGPMNAITPALGLDPHTTPMQAQAHITISTESSGSCMSQDNVHPPLISHKSESSLHKRSKSARSDTPADKSPRRRKVSSIFSSIFGVDANKDHVTRKLSKSNRKPSASGMTTSRESSPKSPMRLTESPVQNEEDDSIQTAIRTSGTFGIRDDGSELSKDRGQDQSPSTIMNARHGFDRTGSGNGSVITQSEGVRRVLYVENLVETPEAGAIDIEAHIETGNARQVSSNGEKGSFPHWEVAPVPLVGLLPTATNTNSQVDPPTTHRPVPASHGQVFPHIPPLSLSSMSVSPDTSSADDHYTSSSSGHGPRALSTPNSTDVQYSSSSHLPHIVIPEDMIDRSVHTSTKSSTARSTKTRPLPRPPSSSTTPLSTPRQTYIPPLTSGTSHPTELPLLIASHLLSTHAAALLKHSTSMNEVSETMRKMAKESLDRGSVMMDMAQRSETIDGLPRLRGDPSKHGQYEGIPLPRRDTLSPRFETYGPGTYEREYNGSNQYHPIQQAYDTLTKDNDNLSPLPIRPSVARQASQAEIRRRKGESLPADLLKEAQRLGTEGWTSLHRAEEAWRDAMNGLTEIVKAQSLREEDEERNSYHEEQTVDEPKRGMGMASTSSHRMDDPSYPWYAPAQSAPHSKQSSLRPSSPNTTVSYSLGSPDTPHKQTASFLPNEIDMVSSTTPITLSQSHIPLPRPHPFQVRINEVSFKRMSESDNRSTIRARPHSLQIPQSRPNLLDNVSFGPQISPSIENEGYTLEHLGISTAPSSVSNGEDRFTPSGSTMTSSSHSKTNEDATIRKNVPTTRRILAKKHPSTANSTAGSGSVEHENSDENETVGRRNKHWWNRRKE